MNGEKTIGKGSYNFEAMKFKPDPKNKGKVIFDDIIHIWFKNENDAIRAIETLLKQIKDKNRTQDLSLTFAGELNFEKED